MPFVETLDDLAPKSRAEWTALATAEGDTSLATFSVAAWIALASATGGFNFNEESEAAWIASATADGALDGDVNSFAESEAAWTAEATAESQIDINVASLAAWTAEASASPTLNEPERFQFQILVNMIAEPITGDRMYRQKLIVDGTEFEVSDWSFKRDKESFRQELTISLNNVDQGALITKDSAVTFQVGIGVRPFADANFTWYTLLDTGYANDSGLTLVPPDDGTDEFTLLALSSMQKKLNLTPTVDLVIYDPNLVAVDEADFRVTYDDYGRAFTTEILAIADLTMKKLLDEVFRDRCGFVSVKTNLPTLKWPLSRIDFQAGEAFAKPIAPKVGMYRPSFIETDAGELQIRATRAIYPAGFPTPESLTLSDAYKRSVTTNYLRTDLIEMVYNLWTYEYDYTSTRQDIETFESDNSGERTTTTITTNVIEYYRYSNPTTPIHEETASIQTIVSRDDGWVLENSLEQFYYNGVDRTRATKTLQVPVPDVSDPSFATILQLVQTEDETYEYKAVPFQPSKKYQSRRLKQTYGLIAVNTAKPRIDGTPFKEALADSHQRGNLEDGVAIESGPIRTEDETTTIVTKDRVQIRVIETDYLSEITNPRRSFRQTRVGDIGRSVLVNDQRWMWIFDAENVERTQNFKKTVNIGELPPLEGRKLCKQLLYIDKNLPRSVSDSIDLDPTLIEGSVKTLTKRDGTSVGVFEITSVTHRGSESGYFTEFTAEQVG